MRVALRERKRRCHATTLSKGLQQHEPEGIGRLRLAAGMETSL